MIGILVSFIKSDKGTIIVPLVHFDRTLFSEYELEIIDKIISKYGALTSEELVIHTHEQESLWNTTKQENDIDFVNSPANISNVSIDLKRLIAGDKQKLSNYEGAYEMMCFNLPSKISALEECMR